MRDYFFLFCIVLLASASLWFLHPKITANDAIDAIVGEASNQSYDTMVCVAQGIIHRGTLKGVYGFHANHNKSESADTYEMAEQAWDDAKSVRDKINGARNWGTYEETFGKNILAHCGDLYFY